MRYFVNLQIFNKMLLLLAAVCLILGIEGYQSFQAMQQAKKQVQLIYERDLILSNLLNEIRVMTKENQAFLMELMVTQDAAMNKELLNNIDNREVTALNLIQQLEKRNLSESEKERLTAYKELLEEYRKERGKVLDLAAQNKNQEAYKIYVESQKVKADQLNNILNAWVQSTETKAKQSYTDAAEQSEHALTIFIITTIIALLFCIVLIIAVTRTITQPLKKMQTLMGDAKDGDLTVRGTYESKDEIGMLTDDFNNMMAGLQETMKRVSESSVNLAANAEELSASSEETEAASQSIASAMQEVASHSDKQLEDIKENVRAVENISIGIGKIAQSVSSVSATSDEVATEAEKGNATVQKAVSQMQQIKSSVGESASIMRQLGETSREVGTVVNVITSIADQTNLLALNAAIEAARAGESGRGFSVVADEVRKLAEQSKQATENITAMIEQIQAETALAVERMEKGNHDVEQGTTIVQEAGLAFNNIVEGVESVVHEIQKISRSSEEMAINSGQVTTSVVAMEDSMRAVLESVQQVASSSQEQLASTGEVANAAHELGKMAEALQEMAFQFKV